MAFVLHPMVYFLSEFVLIEHLVKLVILIIERIFYCQMS